MRTKMEVFSGRWEVGICGVDVTWIRVAKAPTPTPRPPTSSTHPRPHPLPASAPTPATPVPHRSLAGLTSFGSQLCWRLWRCEKDSSSPAPALSAPPPGGAHSGDMLVLASPFSLFNVCKQPLKRHLSETFPNKCHPLL